MNEENLYDDDVADYDESVSDDEIAPTDAVEADRYPSFTQIMRENDELKTRFRYVRNVYR